MKFLISILLTLEVALAAPINISYEGEREDAQIYLKIFEEDYLIPRELIGLIPAEDCGKVKVQGKIDLCINDNGDLLVVSVDRAFIEESLKVFRAP